MILIIIDFCQADLMEMLPLQKIRGSFVSCRAHVAEIERRLSEKTKGDNQVGWQQFDAFCSQNMITDA